MNVRLSSASNGDDVRHPVQGSYMARDSIGSELVALKNRAGLSLAQIAKDAGYAGKSSIQAYFNTDFDPPALDASIAARLKKALVGRGVPPITEAELNALVGIHPGFADHSLPYLAPIPIGQMPIRHKVAAGTWQEVDMEQDEPLGFAPIPYDARFSYADQWAELVSGDCFDREYPDGSIVHVRNAFGAVPELLDGKVVIVERRRNGGLLVERTLKQVVVNKGRIELWPRSTNPKHQKPILMVDSLKAGEEIEVSIAAVVIGGYVRRE